MTPAQKAALDRAYAADGKPVQIPAATARVLADQWRYIDPLGDGWVLTDAGRRSLDAERYRRDLEERNRQIPRPSHEWADRVVFWLKAHRFIGPRRLDDGAHWQHYYTAWNYAEHFAGCLHAGLEPVRPLGEVGWIEDEVRMAAACLADFDAASERATAKGCGVEVKYSVAPAHPKAKADAAAPRPDGTVDLRSYRLRRGLDIDGGPAA